VVVTREHAPEATATPYLAALVRLMMMICYMIAGVCVCVGGVKTKTIFGVVAFEKKK